MTQKFIDRDGLKVLWNQVNLKDYPNNETLMAVIDAIDETKADKDELFSKSWNDLTDRPFYSEETEKWVIDKQEVTFDNSSSVKMRGLSDDFITLFNTVGSHLKVYWNGSIYECEVKYHNIAFYNYIVFADRRAYLVADVLTILNTRSELETQTYEFGVFASQETVKTLDEKFIPKITSSWNDLEDKPFYEETTISENIIINTEHDFTTGALCINNLATVANEVVKITVNENEEYTATVFYVGNPIYEYGLNNFSEGCPFKYDFGHGLIDATGTLGNVNIKITNQSTATTIKKIDEKYLPQLIGKATDEGGEIFNYYLHESSNENFAGHENFAGFYSHAEGFNTKAEGKYSHAEGSNTTASSDYSHAEGGHTTASGIHSHAEGDHTTASKSCSHAEGNDTTASGACSHAEGNDTTASGACSHAEGDHTTASGACSHAEGDHTTASGFHSHAEGDYTTASGAYQHVQGKYNIADVDADGNPLNNYAHIVGNGGSFSYSNAHTLDWSGNAWFSGDVYVGSTSGTNKDEGSKKLATEDYVTTELSDYYLKTEADNLHTEIEDYVDNQVAALVNSAPETLDTLGELAAAFEENHDMVETLNEAITFKANQSDLDKFKTETWTFTLNNGSTVTKQVVIK